MDYKNILGSISTANSEESGRLKKDISGKKRNILKNKMSDGMGGCGKKDGKGACGSKDGKGGPVLDAFRNVASNVADKFKKGVKNTKDILNYYINRPLEELKYRDAVRETKIRAKEKKQSQWLRDQTKQDKINKERTIAK